MADRVRVLMVDDSALMRKVLRSIFDQDDRVEVVGYARDGEQALEKVAQLKPDVITMDVEMPRMDGLTALRHIMKNTPTPVVMLSSCTTDGARITLQCLDAGAVDFMSKPSGDDISDIEKQSREILEMVVGAAKVRGSRFKFLARRGVQISTQDNTPIKSATQQGDAPPSKVLRPGERAVAIGISTGGPVALMSVIPLLPKNLSVPVFLVQHMPKGFTESFAQRMNDESQVRVVEAKAGMDVEPGTVYLAPGAIHMTVVTGLINGKKRIRLSENPTTTLHRPSVDVMMDSVNEAYAGNVIGVIMTGMGDDGAIAMKKLRANGGITIAQDEATSVIYGMPAVVAKNGDAQVILPLDRIADEIVRRL